MSLVLCVWYAVLPFTLETVILEGVDRKQLGKDEYPEPRPGLAYWRRSSEVCRKEKACGVGGPPCIGRRCLASGSCTLLLDCQMLQARCLNTMKTKQNDSHMFSCVKKIYQEFLKFRILIILLDDIPLFDTWHPNFRVRVYVLIPDNINIIIT